MTSFFDKIAAGLIISLLVFGSAAAVSAADNGKTEIVPPNERISDFSARREMAQSLAQQEATLDQSVQEYKRLLKLKPDIAGFIIEAADVFLRAGKRQRALALCNQAADMSSETPETSLELALRYASLGHSSAAMRTLRHALSNSLSKSEKPLRIASIYESCGFFYEAEKLYRKYLDTHPRDWQVWLRLGGLLRSSGRFAEAEGVYRSILQKTKEISPETYFALAQLRFDQKRFADAVRFAEKVLRIADARLADKARLLKGKAYFREQEWCQAQKTFEVLRKNISNEELKAKSWIWCGRIRQKQSDPEAAERCFQKAARVRNTPLTCYLNTPKDQRSEDDYIEVVEALCKGRSDKFVEWGQVFAANDQNNFAIFCFEKALKLEPGYSEARIHLIQTLAGERRYEEALEHLAMLAPALTSSRKVTMLEARILSWNQDYDEALATYKTLHEKNKQDPVPILETARVAGWAKKMPLAFEYYEKLLVPPVDGQLFERLQQTIGDNPSKILRKAGEQLEDNLENDIGYDGYRAFSAASDDIFDSVTPQQQQKIRKVLIDLLPAYLIQRRITLELRAKRHVYHNRLLHAREDLQQLLDVSPDNQQARFMLGQVQCRLGLCDAAADTYERILDINASHNLAKRALEDSRIEHHPGIFLRGAYWHESGRGELSGIDTLRTTAGVDVPVFCRMNLKLAGHHWYENGDIEGETAKATGGSLTLEGKLTAWLQFRLSGTHKDYEDRAYEDQDLGSAEVWAHVYDYAQVGAGFKRDTELYNTFGIRQGVTSDTHWLGLKLQPVRRVTVDAKIRDKNYSDENSGVFHDLSLDYLLSHHPRTLKLILHGEYRDTDKENVYQVDNQGRLQDIVHPYWTPQDYTAWDMILEWRHDISESFFCGNDLHYYDIRVGVGSDSDNNPGASIEGTWHYEPNDHWTFELSGLLHESKDWDASGFWGRIMYRF